MSESPASNGRIEVTKLAASLPDCVVKTKEDRAETFICVAPENLIAVLSFLRDDPELAYEYFSECVGIDYSTWPGERDLPGRFEVVYNLMSLKNSSRIFVKTSVNDGSTIPSAIGVYEGAEYPEREIADLFGVVFAGNELEGRFLLPDDWIGYPLRKEYPLGGEDVLFDSGDRGPAVEDKSMPHAGSSFDGKTGSQSVSGR